jgi:chaperonin GroES
MSNFTPLHARIVLRPLEEVYRGAIILPDNRKKERPRRGVVQSMGPGMLTKWGTRWPMPDCKIGDTVIFNPEGSSDVVIDEEKYVVVRDVNVLAVVEDS